MIRRRKLLSLILCAALLICVLPVGAAADTDFPTVLAEAKKGVVQIYCLGANPDCWIGTGFAVGESGKDSDVFLTNWHVVTGDGAYSKDDVQVWLLQENCTFDAATLEPDPEKSITCEVLKTTKGAPDYAILRATEPVEGYKPLTLLPGDQVKDGQTVYALGYPGVVGDISTSHYGIDDITSTNGIVSQHMVDNRDIRVLMHTAQLSGGNSGGPLITEDGAVVGLNTYGFGEEGEDMSRFCAEYIDYAMEGLDGLGLNYTVFQGQGSGNPGGTDPKPQPNNLPLLIAIGAVVIVAAVVILLVVLKKKKQREELQRQEEARRLEAERRLEEERRQREEAARRAQSVKAKLQMEGGSLYSIRGSGCTIGRSPDCTIVLPAKSPGVSTCHCRLEFQGNQLMLIDMDSTYGTYIHNKRIPPKTPVALKPGSSFCLGSEKFKFTVC